MERQYDFVLAGFGLAGMSLLHELSRHAGFAGKRILVIDADDKQKNDRTWSFWSETLYGLEDVVLKTWSEGTVYDTSGRKIPLEMKDYAYHTVRGLDYYNFVRAALAPFSNITYLQDEILSTDPSGTVRCVSGDYRGGKVFKSYFKREEIAVEKDSVFLWQHFKGWFIKTPQPKFDPGDFTLMDYRECHGDRTNFFYVLPHAEDRALVEFTEFSNEFYTQEEYDGMIADYLKKYWGIEEYEVEETEFNAIPMTDMQFAEPVQGNVIHVGTMGGYVKASSGYCFTRTHEKNRALAEAVMQGEAVTNKTLRSPKRYLAYDRAVLTLMATGRVRGQLLFPALFEKLGGDKVFRFLDEKVGFPQELEVMMSVPKKGQFISFYISRAASAAF